MDEAAVETLLHALSRRVRDEWIILPGVGWLTVRHYKAYEGRSPRTGGPVSVPDKWLAFFAADPEIYRTLDGLPPSGVSFADERTRYLRAMRPDRDEDDEELDDDDPATVATIAGAETIAETIRGHLCAGEPADIPGLGVFEVVEKPSRRGADPETGEEITVPARRIVRFVAAETLKARLNSTPGSD